jgi:hypothetical protein
VTRLLFVCCVVVVAFLGSCGGATPAATTGEQHPHMRSPSAVLDEMDTRKPVPLMPVMAHHQKQNMRDHLVVVQEIVTALAIEDFAAVENSAKRIGFSDEMGQQCSHMGAGAPGFTEQAIAFHKTADGIVTAAREKNRDGVMRSLSLTLQTCTGCHATWKQEIVDETAWQQATGSEPPAHGMQHGMQH